MDEFPIIDEGFEYIVDPIVDLDTTYEYNATDALNIDDVPVIINIRMELAAARTVTSSQSIELSVGAVIENGKVEILALREVLAATKIEEYSAMDHVLIRLCQRLENCKRNFEVIQAPDLSLITVNMKVKTFIQDVDYSDNY
ncbi:hypothetical protein OROMI_021012 [Orobanche minor]